MGLLLVFSVTSFKIDQNKKSKPFNRLGRYAKILAKIQATAVFLMEDMRNGNDEKSKTTYTARLTQRDIFKTRFRLARPAFFRFRCYLIIKMKLQYYIVVIVVIHILKSKGVAEMTNKTNKIKKKGAF